MSAWACRTAPGSSAPRSSSATSTATRTTSTATWKPTSKRQGGVLAGDRVAAVHRDRRSGHEIRSLAGEKDGDAGEILRLAPAAGGRAREHALVQAGHVLPRPLRERGIDPARQHRVHLDALARPGARERARELHDAAL